MSEVHHTVQWQKLRRARIQQARNAAEPCYRCGGPIDYSLSGRLPAGPTVEHIQPASLRPDLALNIANCAVSHNECNRLHGAHLGGLAAQKRLNPKATHPMTWHTSRVW